MTSRNYSLLLLLRSAPLCTPLLLSRYHTLSPSPICKASALARLTNCALDQKIWAFFSPSKQLVSRTLVHPSSSSLLLHCGCTSIRETDSEKPLTLSYVSHPILCLSPYPISLTLSYRASRTLVHPTDSEKPPDAELRNACDIVHHTPRLSRTLLHKQRYSLPVLHAPYVPQCYTLPTSISRGTS